MIEGDGVGHVRVYAHWPLVVQTRGARDGEVAWVAVVEVKRLLARNAFSRQEQSGPGLHPPVYIKLSLVSLTSAPFVLVRSWRFGRGSMTASGRRAPDGRTTGG